MGKWQKQIIPIVKEKLRAYTYKPTIRGMFYNLVTDGKLQNIHKQYKSQKKRHNTYGCICR
jgi:hypothetical protein